MSSPTQDFFPPLWRALGLGTAAGFVSLGSYIAFLPIQVTTTFGLRSPDSTAQGDKYVRANAAWIGARDISIGVALLALYYQERPREMGTVILSTMILCATDTYFIWRARGDALAVGVGIGAVGWGVIGWNLFNL